jgi:hypothetical protein
MTAALDHGTPRIAGQRLRYRDGLLFILIGAEQWCARCRDMRPHFDAQVTQAERDETWLRCR